MNTTRTGLILTSGQEVSARLVQTISEAPEDLQVSIYQLPGGRYVVGYTEDG